VTWFGFEWKPSADAALLALVVLSSGVGSYVHAAVSFTDYVGNRGLTVSWIWWYVLRLFVGSSLAVIFYFAIRGGFFSTGGDAAQINPYGIAAISGLVGLFSKQATDKLREIFDTAFRVEQGGDVDRGDSLNTTPGAEAGGAAPGTTIMVATSTAAPSDVDLGAVDQALTDQGLTDQVVTDQGVTDQSTVDQTTTDQTQPDPATPGTSGSDATGNESGP
jgi:hypothetical protein